MGELSFCRLKSSFISQPLYRFIKTSKNDNIAYMSKNIFKFYVIIKNKLLSIGSLICFDPVTLNFI